MQFIIIGGGCYGIYHSGQLYKAVQKGKLPSNTEFIIVDRNAQPKAQAVHTGKANFRFVQSDWQTFLQTFLAGYDRLRDGESVQIVPAPFAPHLFFDWLKFSVGAELAKRGRDDIAVERAGFDHKMNLAYEYTDQTGNHFISRAGWTCPTTCIEPRNCPAVKGLRDWDLEEDLRNFAAGQAVRPSVSANAKLVTAGVPNGQTASAELPVLGFYDSVETFNCHHFTHGIGTVPALRLFEARERLLNLALGLNLAKPLARVAVGTVSHCHGAIATIELSLRTL